MGEGDILGIHTHSPVSSGVIAVAGFRKDNLPCGTWSFLCSGEILVCACRRKFVKVDDCLQEIEGIYVRLGSD